MQDILGSCPHFLISVSSYDLSRLIQTPVDAVQVQGPRVFAGKEKRGFTCPLSF